MPAAREEDEAKRQKQFERELRKDDEVLLGVGILFEDENEALDARRCRFGVL